MKKLPYLLAAAGPQSSALANAPGVDLTIQGVYNILYGLTCWATSFIMVFMILVIIWYGFQFLITRGDPGKFTGARKGLTWAIVGIIVILGAQTIIATVGNAINPGHYPAVTLFTGCQVPQ